MSATVTEATRDAVMSRTLEALTGSIGLVPIVLLIALLLEREVLRVARPGSETALRALDVVLVPLFLTFGFIVVARVVDFLR